MTGIGRRDRYEPGVTGRKGFGVITGGSEGGSCLVLCWQEERSCKSADAHSPLLSLSWGCSGEEGGHPLLPGRL